MAFNENLKKAREMHNMTQLELAKAIGVSQPTVAQYEKGLILPTIVTGVSLAKVLGTTCEALTLETQHTEFDNLKNVVSNNDLSDCEKAELVKAWKKIRR